MEIRGTRRLKYNGNKKQTGNGQTPLGMEQECIGSEGPRRTVALEMKMMKKNNNWFEACKGF
jgi:hypothetical protein